MADGRREVRMESRAAVQLAVDLISTAINLLKKLTYEDDAHIPANPPRHSPRHREDTAEKSIPMAPLVKAPIADDEEYDIAWAGKFLRKSSQTIRKWISTGTIKARLVGGVGKGKYMIKGSEIKRFSNPDEESETESLEGVER